LEARVIVLTALVAVLTPLRSPLRPLAIFFISLLIFFDPARQVNIEPEVRIFNTRHYSIINARLSS